MRKALFLCCFYFLCNTTFAQVAIGGSVASNVMKNFIFLYLQQKDVQRSLFS